ncbi:AMP-binding protein [Epidermidibacterium keratini]|uniref:AMP-binding protein n=1 Tax=Epidermidibacterium keratini TaxID=1891644 RepID=A0A7L4YQP3_9ACTN|nr:AMP-binding protein [Epidermidibacterium keratini]QHC01224.1 AMP-binding protein [Epidermidibacterium keratini]
MEIAPYQTGPSVGRLAIRTLAAYPDRVAFAWDRGSITYAETAAVIGRYQKVLSDAGLQRGDGVAALGGNRFEVWALGIAVQSLGLYITWLHPMGGLSDQLFQIEDAGVTALVLDETHFAERAEQLATEASGLGLRVWTMGPSPYAEDLTSAAEAVGEQPVRQIADASDHAIINYTGGTTGRPKGAWRRHRSVVQGAVDIITDFAIPRAARYLMVAPMSHVAGSKVMPVLVGGGTVHLLTGFDAARVLETIERERITMALFVPTMIYALLDHPDLDERDLSSLELVLYGASPMSVSRLREGIERIGPVFSQLYGQTECYPVSVLPKEDHDPEHAERLLSCGKPVVGVEVSIRDEAGNELPIGEPGELCVRGGSAMEGYWKRGDLTAEALAGGWLHTGDIAKQDAEGYLYIVDRKKDMIISGGFNVFPREVEDALTAHPDVAAAAVYGVPHEKWGEQVTASVVLKPGASADEAALIAHVRDLKGAVQAPKVIETLPELPQTAVGKINKRALRDKFLD